MKISVIICEFNPLHSGHKRLLDFARGFCDKVVCVMSGNFVQRGMPAVANKFCRARHAIEAGADLVVELPTVFATASAEDFALGGVQIANSLGADYLVFGSECGQIEPLVQCAERLDDAEVNTQIRNNMAEGDAYPKAVAKAIGNELLQKPNNVLAVEYIRALKKTGSTIVPVTLQREDNYNGAPNEYASSSALRGEPALREKFGFEFVNKDIDDSIEQKYRDFATHFLATADKAYLESIADVTEGLHNRIFAADKTHGFEKMMEDIKTKRYTRTKLQRIVLNCLLGITKDAVAEAKRQPVAAKVLAVKANEVALLANTSLSTDNTLDKITAKADRLFASFDGQTPPNKLVKV